jgi:hypothetical protein
MTENNIPDRINQNILCTIKEGLNPSFYIILLKLFSTHLIVGAITLALCPQLGFQTFKTNINLMHYFMYWGKTSCDIFCGTFFMSTSMLIAYFVLSFDEKRVIRSKKLLSSLLLILFTIGFFIIFNPNLFVELSLLWIVGAFSGAFISLEIGQLFSKIFLVKSFSKSN